jgi:hypothetical protein
MLVVSVLVQTSQCGSASSSSNGSSSGSSSGSSGSSSSVVVVRETWQQCAKLHIATSLRGLSCCSPSMITISCRTDDPAARKSSGSKATMEG